MNLNVQAIALEMSVLWIGRPKPMRVVFTDAGHTHDFNGAVDSIDSGTGRVRILLDDEPEETEPEK